ncbi:DNA-deoxyinosine glycosylase [Chryseobacterium sp.]|uniref:DNA-deoxyinosine glycosylase n=1 Tax=Chryseobacterium sp. TaxID=1871047 RepID=UPI0011CAB891|nr:DNA-deoxyinosine glycosylase [Chryseobacterium sp.]TXF79599.1 DNA-deoxyinosine glycosylase [Chryseobacterium sp.]
MQNRISSFPPIISESSKVLILGSVPGVKSLEMQEYYAHPQNHFWKIIFRLFNEEITTDYSQKMKILDRNRIAVWDVIDTCERDGSLDTRIRNEEHNDIVKLLKDFPNIEAIFCNGQKSFKNLTKIVGKDFDLPVFVMPSTSPLHTISLERKLEEWKKVLEI